MNIEEIIDRNFTKISDKYRKFVLEKDECRKCSIYNHYEQVIQSEGNAEDPTFMFVGECGGRDESEQVRPFIGAAGQRLRSELRKYPKTFNRNTVLISNVVSCRPLNNKFPKELHEPKRCFTLWLEREIRIVKPKVIIVLGNTSMRFIRAWQDEMGENGITATRGKWKFLNKYRAWSLPTFHPSYVIRSERSEKKYIGDQFNADIKMVATMWQTMVGDYRLALSKEEWSRHRAMQKVGELGLFGK